MITIQLTDVQYKNLHEFLKRTDLKGSEVAAYVDVVNAIANNPKEVKEGE